MFEMLGKSTRRSLSFFDPFLIPPMVISVTSVLYMLVETCNNELIH